MVKHPNLCLNGIIIRSFVAHKMKLIFFFFFFFGSWMKLYCELTTEITIICSFALHIIIIMKWSLSSFCWMLWPILGWIWKFRQNVYFFCYMWNSWSWIRFRNEFDKCLKSVLIAIFSAIEILALATYKQTLIIIVLLLLLHRYINVKF